MRKIISILVALGLVLAFSVVAMPATAGAATTTCAANVTLSNSCAGHASTTYTIDFVATKTLLAGNDELSFKFGAGTTFGTVTVTIDTGGGPVAVPSASITKAAPELDFVVPTQVDLNDHVTVVITGVTNPAIDGAYSMTLDYGFACCGPEDFACASYTIKPLYSSYGLAVDFGPTYPGIASDFVPPFKACGQNSSEDNPSGFNTTYIAPYWYDQFILELLVTTPGCNPPCVNATLSFNVTSFPTTTAKVSLNISGQLFTLNSTASSDTLVYNITLDASVGENFTSLLHFDTVGDYTIHFWVECPAGQPSCTTGCSPAASVIASKTYNFHAYQQKNAFKMTLDDKWNLISLPLVPLGEDGSISITDALASMPAADLANLVSIWYYDAAGADWLMYPGGGLTTLEDGKAYWLRMTYPTADCGNYSWWIWGTLKPEPPAAPSQYPVVEGWNMVGFTSESTTAHPSDYLWNWAAAAPYPVVYGWNHGCWTTQGWSLINFTGGFLVPGQGYWVAFPSAGAVYVP